MGPKTRKGAVIGLCLAVIIILTQPFHPLKGLIPELTSFLATVPLWVAALLFPKNVTPLAEGGVILIYFLAVGLLLGIAFERKRIWGWLLLITLLICHYVVYDQFSRQVGEVIQSLLNHFS